MPDFQLTPPTLGLPPRRPLSIGDYALKLQMAATPDWVMIGADGSVAPTTIELFPPDSFFVDLGSAMAQGAAANPSGPPLSPHKAHSYGALLKLVAQGLKALGERSWPKLADPTLKWANRYPSSGVPPLTPIGPPNAVLKGERAQVRGGAFDLSAVVGKAFPAVEGMPLHVLVVGDISALAGGGKSPVSGGGLAYQFFHDARMEAVLGQDSQGGKAGFFTLTIGKRP